MPANDFGTVGSSDWTIQDSEPAQAPKGLPLVRSRREVLLQRMSLENRGAFERITALRKRIGTIEFDVLEALRKMREDG
jgi:hypothetical protein